MEEKFSLKDRINSFKYAFNGLKILLKEEHNMRIHFVIMLLVTGCGFLFGISLVEWTSVLLAIGFVIVTEAVNSAIENVADFVSPGKNENIKKIKDVSAFAVLFSAFIAVIVGLIIFIPKIYGILFN